jgi:copper(I)-binding protein
MGKLATRLVVCGISMLFALTGSAAAQEKRITASDASVKLPGSGATQTMAVANFENPGMYDVYLTKASTDVAGKVELRDASKSGDAALKPLEFIVVPAHEWTYMDPKGPHFLLMDLKRPLKEGETITLTVTTEAGASLEVPAVVK